MANDLLSPHPPGLTKSDAAKWVAALESGQWEQYFGDLWPFDAFPTRKVCAYGLLLLIKADLRKITYHEKHFATALNDLFGYDFPQIAQIVRQRYQILEGSPLPPYPPFW